MEASLFATVSACSPPFRRLSYHQRIVDIVPPTFSALIPAEPISIYKYGSESSGEPALIGRRRVAFPPAQSGLGGQRGFRFHLRLIVFRSASLPGYPVAITMGNAIKNRASNEEILAILKELPNPNQDEDDGQFCAVAPRSKLRGSRRRRLSADTLSLSGSLPDEGESFNPLKVDVFLQTLLSVASKSFSHSFSALGK